MATRVFHIDEPEKLTELDKLTKETPSGLNNVIRVWQANRRKQGKTAWDNCFYAVFSGTRERDAYVLRLNAKQLPACRYPIRYNKALHYCEEHLREAGGT